MDTIEQFDSHVMQTYDRLPLVMESGSGRTCTDEDGKRYLDFGSGIGTNSLGYCDPAWADAVCAQVRRMQHTSKYRRISQSGCARSPAISGCSSAIPAQKPTNAPLSWQENTALINTAQAEM